MDRSVPSLGLFERAAAHADRVAIVNSNDGNTFTYGQLLRDSHQFATKLLDVAYIGPIPHIVVKWKRAGAERCMWVGHKGLVQTHGIVTVGPSGALSAFQSSSLAQVNEDRAEQRRDANPFYVFCKIEANRKLTGEI